MVNFLLIGQLLRLAPLFCSLELQVKSNNFVGYEMLNLINEWL